MSFLGSLFGTDAPDEKYVDDQSMQEDHRDDKFVGPAIDTACNVYDTMFDALKFVIRGKADVLEKMDKMVSKLEKKCKEIADKYQEILKNLNDNCAEAYSTGDYPGWKPNINSTILNLMKKVYQEKFGKEPKVMVIHAGLECGILGSKYPYWDMVSFGPTLVHPHSPDEALLIESMQPFWDFLIETLRNIPEKEVVA